LKKSLQEFLSFFSISKLVYYQTLTANYIPWVKIHTLSRQAALDIFLNFRVDTSSLSQLTDDWVSTGCRALQKLTNDPQTGGGFF